MSLTFSHASRLLPLLLALACALPAGAAPGASAGSPAAISVQGRIVVPLIRNKIGLLLAAGTVNGVPCRLVVDTGASGSVFEATSGARLKMKAGAALDNAAGAGGQVQLRGATGNVLQIGDWKQDRFDTVLMSLEHVNQAFVAAGDAPVDGVIGADVLVPGEAVIDYGTMTLYLKPTTGTAPAPGAGTGTESTETPDK